MNVVSRLHRCHFVVLSAALACLGSIQAASIYLDVNFNALQSPGLNAVKTGLAATGLTANDFWNDYSRDAADGTYLLSGNLSALKTVDGLATTAGLTIVNADGAWANGAPDPMYNTYLYGLNNGNVSLSITNLSRGTYNLYLYGLDSTYNVDSGAVSYSHKSLPAGPYTNPAWIEGLQYVLFQNLAIDPADPLSVTIQPGSDGYAKISGLQLVLVPEPGSSGLLLLSGLIFAARRWRAKK